MLLNSWPPQDKRFLSHFRSAFTPVDAFSSSSLSAQPGRHLMISFGFGMRIALTNVGKKNMLLIFVIRLNQRWLAVGSRRIALRRPSNRRD